MGLLFKLAEEWLTRAQIELKHTLTLAVVKELLTEVAPEECCFSFSAASSCFETSNHCPYNQLPCIIVNTISIS
jgi:hypothetical protein